MIHILDHPSDGEVLHAILQEQCRAFGFQLEEGKDGTPHYQGQCQFLLPTRTPSDNIRDPDGELIFQGIHWERTSEYSVFRHNNHGIEGVQCHEIWLKYFDYGFAHLRNGTQYKYTTHKSYDEASYNRYANDGPWVSFPENCFDITNH